MRDDAERGRFELEVEGRVVHADYRRDPDALTIFHVYAPPPLRGTGAADRLMAEIAGQARSEGRRIVALCGYARGWLAARAEYRDLLEPG
jgi:uncharacterized protein